MTITKSILVVGKNVFILTRLIWLILFTTCYVTFTCHGFPYETEKDDKTLLFFFSKEKYNKMTSQRHAEQLYDGQNTQHCVCFCVCVFLFSPSLSSHFILHKTLVGSLQKTSSKFLLSA